MYGSVTWRQGWPRPERANSLWSTSETGLTAASGRNRLSVQCSTPGYARWTVRLLADQVIKAAIVDHIAPETIRQFLKKTNVSLG
jgi:hypothetical protein